MDPEQQKWVRKKVESSEPYADHDVQETNLDEVQLDEEVEIQPPPPSYEEAVRSAQRNKPELQSLLDVPEAAPEGSTVDEDGDELSPEEVALVLRLQEGRNSYLPSSARRGSNDEAIEMIDKGEAEYRAENDEDADTNIASRREPDMALDFVDTSQPSSRARGVEEGRGRETTGEPECLDWGILNGPLTSFRRAIHSQSPTRVILVVALVTFIVGFIIFLGVFPASFIYVEYYEIALKQSKMTNTVDRDTVYYPGCHLLGPDTQFLRFQATAHNITETLSVFTANTLSVTVSYSLLYFIRPAEVGQLYSMFMFDYDQFFRPVVTSTIRNYAATELTVDQFRFNRTQIERQLHTKLRMRLGGDCCPECCPSGCQSNTICSVCTKSGSCDQGYHVDVRYFFLMKVEIPSEVFDQYLRRTLEVIDRERKVFDQNYKMVVKETERITAAIKNEADEIISNATAEANRIELESEADREKVVQKSYATALKEFYSYLNVTEEDRQLSYMLIRTLEEERDNLYLGYGFDSQTEYTP